MTDIGQSSWPEARGPHLPDAVTRRPWYLWLFVAVAALAAFDAAQQWRLPDGIEAQVVGQVVLGGVSSVALALLGAALLWRHPDAADRFPLLVAGVALAAVAKVLDVVAASLRDVFATLTPPIGDSVVVPLSLAYDIALRTVGVVAIFLIARGLAAARRRPDDDSARGLPLVLTLVVLTSQALYLADISRTNIDTSMPTVLMAVEGITLATLGLLSWAYLVVVGLRGWAVSESPSIGWLLAAAAGASIVAGQAVVSAAGWLHDPLSTDGIPAGVIAGLWIGQLGPILLLVAFALGLPAASPDREAATTPGSAGS